MSFQLCILLSAFICGVTGQGLAQESNSLDALALLRGVESARSAIQSLRVELLLTYKYPNKTDVFHFIVDQQGSDRRVEHLSDSIDPAVYLIQKDIVSSLRSKTGEDLEVYDIHRSSETRGDVAFDPGLIGLSDRHSVGMTVRKSLWINDYESAVLLPSELIGMKSLRRVKVTDNGNVSDLWIDDESFRVHRRRFEYPGGCIQVDSDYTGANKSQVLPNGVKATRTENGIVASEMTLTVKSYEVNVPISPQRFTIDSFNIPINTMRNDYRISRITGYWNGLEFVDDPVSSVSPTSIPMPPSGVQPPFVPMSRSRVWLIVLNVVVLAGLLGIILWRWVARSS